MTLPLRSSSTIFRLLEQFKRIGAYGTTISNRFTVKHNGQLNTMVVFDYYYGREL